MDDGRSRIKWLVEDAETALGDFALSGIDQQVLLAEWYPAWIGTDEFLRKEYPWFEYVGMDLTDDAPGYAGWAADGRSGSACLHLRACNRGPGVAGQLIVEAWVCTRWKDNGKQRELNLGAEVDNRDRSSLRTILDLSERKIVPMIDLSRHA